MGAHALAWATVLLAAGCTASRNRTPSSDFLAGNVDSTISPGEDFYRFATGGWVDRNPIPPTQVTWGRAEQVTEEIYLRQRRTSEMAALARATRGTAEQIIGDFWSSAMDTLSIERIALEPLRADLRQIAQIASIDDFVDVLAEFHRRNMSSVLFTDFTTLDGSDSRRWVYVLNRGGLTLPSPGYYTASDSQSRAMREALHEFMAASFRRLGHDSAGARGRAEALFAFESALAAAGATPYEERRVSRAEIAAIAPVFNWYRYWEQIGFEQDSVTLRRPAFLAALGSLLRSTPIETMKDYLAFVLLRANGPFLDSATRAAGHAFSRTLTGRAAQPERWRTVVEWENAFLGAALGQLFVSEHFTRTEEQRYRRVSESVRGAFRVRLQAAPWLAPSTRLAAVRKLDAMRVELGSPTRWPSLEGLEVRSGDLFGNIARINRWIRAAQMDQLRIAQERFAWIPSVSMSNAEYFADRNFVTMDPGAIAVPGVRDHALDDAFIYGSTFLGHEIAHGFDREGRMFDEDGTRRNWWSPSDSVEFVRRADVLASQFSRFEPVPGLRVDGRRTQSENIADLVGIRVALDAFKSTEQYRRGRKIGGYTPLQRFFLGYAYRQAGHRTDASLRTQLLTDSHAPDRERVNGIVVHIAEFYEAFEVREGQRMFLAPSERVIIF